MPAGMNAVLDALTHDPYPIYAALRAGQPVAHQETLDVWLVARYADVVEILKSPTFSSDQRNGRSAMRVPLLPRGPAGEAREASLPNLLCSDPPVHTRMRQLVAKAFTPRIVTALAPRVEAIAEALLAPALTRGGLEFMSQFARPLPVLVIAELLGVPASDRDVVAPWSEDQVVLSNPLLPDAVRARAAESMPAMVEYLERLFALRRSEPRDDLVSALVAAEEGGDRLSRDELIGTAVLLMVAGHETTTNGLGNALLALAMHPEEHARLARDPGLMPTAIEEFVRYDSPVQLVMRQAMHDFEVCGTRLKKGSVVVPLIASANRDAAVFWDPNRLDLGRTKNPHLGFGLGRHFCVGSHLARLELRIALATVLRRIPRFKVQLDTVRRRPHPVLRGPSAMELSF